MKTNKVKALILDMDGVLWRGSEIIGNLENIFLEIARKKIKYSFATNNSTKTIDQYKEKLISFGVPILGDEIFTSAKAAGQVLLERFPEGGNVYVVGENGLIITLEEMGFTHSPDKPLAVVVGLDSKVTYEKMKQASYLINNGTPFIGTNPDKTLPTPEGLAPGAGSILAAIEAATNKKPEIIGKPLPTMYRFAIKYLNEKPENTLAVGDRLETDIAGGQEAGCRTALVLSGVTTKEMAKKWTPGPDFIAENLSRLIEIL